MKEDLFEIHRWDLFIPVFLSLGSSLYFSLNSEPNFYISIIFLFFTVISISFLKLKIKLHIENNTKFNTLFTWLFFIIKMMIVFFIGFGAAQIRTNYLNVQKLPENIENIKIDGFIESIEDVPRGTEKKQRILRRIILTDINGLPFKINKNFKIRIQGPFGKLRNLKSLSRVSLETTLFQPPKKISISGYDSEFDAYFKGISAFGKVKKIFNVYEENCKNNNFSKSRKVQRIRNFLREKIVNSMNKDTFPIASSIMIGDKSGISLKTREAFTKSGVSHILAISGLHMGLLAALVFLIVSKLLVFIPRLAERFSVKKISAFLTIPVTLFYLLMSGASFSAMRAFIMITISMIAIMIDQKPISLKNVAIAASIILFIFPESIYSVSFQLSFASVTGLCFFYERYRFNINFENKIFKKAYFILNPIIQSVISTLIATLATAPLIIYTFQRFTFVGVLGNLIAIPLLSLFIMPIGILSIIISLFKTDNYFFKLFEYSIELLLKSVDIVSKLPFSDCLIAKPSSLSIILITLGFIWLIVWQKRKRFLGFAPLSVGIVLFFCNKPPTVFIGNDFFGVRNNECFFISDKINGNFHAKVWSQESGMRNINEMSKDQKKYWNTKLMEYKEKLPKNSYMFLWKLNDEVNYEVFDPYKKKRPWSL